MELLGQKLQTSYRQREFEVMEGNAANASFSPNGAIIIQTQTEEWTAADFEIKTVTTS